MLKSLPRHRMLLLTAALAAGAASAQTSQIALPQPPGLSADDYQGSVVSGKATPGVLPLSLDEAIGRGLKDNLGAILAGTDVKSTGGERLQQLQPLLPTVTGNAQDSVAQVNLQAEGLRLPGFPKIIGPFGYTDFRATLNQAVLNVPSLENYLAARHNFAASKLTLEDSRDLIVLTVGNAYLLCLADDARIEALKAQVATSKVSLDQAVQNHQSGVSPRLDELRARVDYQTEQQSLISAQNQEQKDRIALARAIGLPLDQQFELTDKVPYAEFDTPEMETAIAAAEKNRYDRKAAAEQVEAARRRLSSAHAERLPQITAEADYGYIGVNPNNSYATHNATGKATGPIFEESRLRGDARVAAAELAEARAVLGNLDGQIRADVKDAILDIQAAAKLVGVSKSNVELSNEELKEAQERFTAGVSDNLAVSQAQAAVAQADSSYVGSLYQFNVAKLSLARATGVARAEYKTYLGGR